MTEPLAELAAQSYRGENENGGTGLGLVHGRSYRRYSGSGRNMGRKLLLIRRGFAKAGQTDRPERLNTTGEHRNPIVSKVRTMVFWDGVGSRGIRGPTLPYFVGSGTTWSVYRTRALNCVAIHGGIKEGW